MTFKIAAGSTVSRSEKNIGFRLVIEVTCPKCGTNVGPGCLITLNAKVGYGAQVGGFGLVTPCCHMLVLVDRDFERWVVYQEAARQQHSEVTCLYNEKGIVCDISDGVEEVAPKP